MILPTKHIRTEKSLIGLGAELVKRLDKPKTVSSLWESARDIRGINSYGLFVLTLDFIFLLGMIETDGVFLSRIKC